jgi:hypothetical protein
VSANEERSMKFPERTPAPTSTLLALALAALLGACATPQPAREFAGRGAAMADRAQAELQAYSERSQRAYERREAIVRALAASEIADNSGGAFRAWVAERAGVSGTQAQTALIQQLADRSRGLREQAEAALAAHDQKLAAAAGAVPKPDTKALADTRRAFLVLAQELTPAEWLAFAQGYLKQVNQDLKALADTGGK